jgi:hypothetical protein
MLRQVHSKLKLPCSSSGGRIAAEPAIEPVATGPGDRHYREYTATSQPTGPHVECHGHRDRASDGHRESDADVSPGQVQSVAEQTQGRHDSEGCPHGHPWA